jgi:TetR/AcrR family fatty acid metabolism transcriptional regulator
MSETPITETGPSAKPAAAAVDKRRAILEAAIRVFARQGYHATRVSDIADEAGVAYGLVYHYFRSKEAVMTELFTERWSLLLTAGEEVRAGSGTPREKLAAIAGFIFDSYRREPDLMKVIIIEVTRAANSFGRTHLPEIRRAYDQVASIVREAQEEGLFRTDIDADFVGMSYYGAIEQLLSGWVFELIPATDEEFDRARGMVVELICGGLERR